MTDAPVQNQPHGAAGEWVAPAALLLLLVGWLVALLLGGGLELHRSAVAMPLVVAAALLGLTGTLRSGRALSTPLLLAGGTASGPEKAPWARGFAAN